MRVVIVSLAGILLLGAASAVNAEARANSSISARTGSQVVFSDEEVRVIRKFYASQEVRDSKRNSKRRQSAKSPLKRTKLVPGKPLPRDISLQTLPYELREALPPVPDGHERIIVDGSILLFEVTTQEVRDILPGMAKH
jgi:hypothetical protein